MPTQTEKDWTVAAVVVVVVLDQALGDSIVDLLVVLLRGREDTATLLALSSAVLLRALGSAAEGEVSSYTSKSCGSKTSVESSVAASTSRRSWSLVSIAAASLALESLARNSDTASGGPEDRRRLGSAQRAAGGS